MSNQPTLSTCVVLPTTGRVLRAFGDEITVHLGGAETGGRHAVFTAVTPPGGGPPLHYHLNEDECFLVQEGRAEFYTGGIWTEVPVGTVVFTPKGVVHSYRNCGDVPLRLLVQASPSGFEQFFARCAEEFAKSDTPDMSRIVKISAEHGIHYVNADGSSVV